jgi:hypothetical protein
MAWQLYDPINGQWYDDTLYETREAYTAAAHSYMGEAEALGEVLELIAEPVDTSEPLESLEEGMARDDGHLRHAACGQEGLDGRDNGAPSADHVVHNDRGEALDIAHNPLDPHVLATETGLMHDGQGPMEGDSVAFCQLCCSKVWRDDHSAVSDSGAYRVHQQGHGAQMLQGHREKPFQSDGMEIDGHQAVQATGADHIGDKARAVGLPPIRPTVLAGMAKVRHDHGQVGCASTAAGIIQE